MSKHTRPSGSVYDLPYLQQNNHSKERPLTGLGEGDSELRLDVLANPDTLFETLKQDVNWQEMMHKGGAVPRLISIQGCVQEDGSEPLYRHPADEQPTQEPFLPVVDQIRKAIEKEIKQPLNHTLIQYYRNGTDYISEHADKTLDITKGSAIVNLSLGCTRVMTLRAKKDARKEGSDTPSRQKQRISMPHNSLFVLGWDSNRFFTHAVSQDKRPVTEKRPDELAFGGERISLTFRHIGTYRQKDGSLTGQGARKGDKMDSQVETEKLLFAFAAENQTSGFDWDQWYAEGFDVVNMRDLPLQRAQKKGGGDAKEE